MSTIIGWVVSENSGLPARDPTGKNLVTAATPATGTSSSVFAMAVLTLLVCSWLLVVVSAGIVNVQVLGDILSTTSSLRLGIALIALAPLIAASIDAARRELFAKFAYLRRLEQKTNALD